MRVDIEQLDFTFSPPLQEPSWSPQVPRWYQLDGAAFALAELFARKTRNMDLLIMASPLASNLTDWEFVQSGCQHAQKFVHTLPNVRASMALKAAEHNCFSLCLQKGPETRDVALREFFYSSQFQSVPALAMVDLLEFDEGVQKRQVYRSTLLTASDRGSWRLELSETSASDFKTNEIWARNPFAQKQTFKMGPWLWEKLS